MLAAADPLGSRRPGMSRGAGCGRSAHPAPLAGLCSRRGRTDVPAPLRATTSRCRPALARLRVQSQTPTLPTLASPAPLHERRDKTHPKWLRRAGQRPGQPPRLHQMRLATKGVVALAAPATAVSAPAQHRVDPRPGRRTPAPPGRPPAASRRRDADPRLEGTPARAHAASVKNKTNKSPLPAPLSAHAAPLGGRLPPGAGVCAQLGSARGPGRHPCPRGQQQALPRRRRPGTRGPTAPGSPRFGDGTCDRVPTRSQKN